MTKSKIIIFTFAFPVLIFFGAVALIYQFGDRAVLDVVVDSTSVLSSLVWSLPLVALGFGITSSRALKSKHWGTLVRKFISSPMSFLFEQPRLLPIFLCALFAGVSEEVLFRGFFQVKWGLVVAAVTFAVFHFANVYMFLLLLCVGFYFGAAYHEMQNLLVPIVAHTAFDFVVFWRYQDIYQHRDSIWPSV